MDRNLSDKQLDRIAKDLLKDFSPESEVVNAVADSPKLWWSVRSRIEAEKPQHSKGWFSAFRVQILAFGALALTFLLGVAFLALNTQVEQDQTFTASTANENMSVQTAPIEKASVSPVPERSTISDYPQVRPVRNVKTVRSVVPQKAVAETQKRKVVVRSAEKAETASMKTEETKTDFIALTYAGNSESGQIVRMKVPSTMMVSLGVKTHLEKESELVNADVVIGDDGLARAIRFVR